MDDDRNISENKKEKEKSDDIKLIKNKNIEKIISNLALKEISEMNYIGKYDIISLFLSENHFHIITNILCCLDANTLSNFERVSRTWRSCVTKNCIWQIMLRYQIKNNSTWNALSFKRGWNKYVDYKYDMVGSDYFRRIYWLTVKDFRNLQWNWNFGRFRLNKITCHNRRGLKGVYCIQYDNKYIYSGHRDYLIRIWNGESLKPLSFLEGHQGSVLSLQVIGSTLISASTDCSIKIWDLSRFACICTLREHTNSALHVRFDSEIIVSCSKDKSIIVWNFEKENSSIRTVIRGHIASVNAVEFDDDYIVSGSGDSTVKVWDRKTYVCKYTLNGHSRGIACIHYKYPILMSGSSDTEIKIWNIEKGTLVRTLCGHKDLVRSIRFDEEHIISGSYDGEIIIWSTKIALRPNSVPIAIPYKHHNDRVLRIHIDYFTIISSSLDNSIIMWDFLDHRLSDVNLWRPIINSTTCKH